MSVNKKSIYNDGSINKLTILGVASIGMIAVSIYLISHYFSINFPSGISKGSLCDINSFFNCGASTTSPLSNLFGVPIAVFGMLTGIFIFLGFFFKNEEIEKTNHLLLGINIVGCIALGLYSTIILGSLCPFCFLYYIFSFIAFYLFYKNSNHFGLSVKVISIYLVVTLATSFGFYNSVKSKNDNIQAVGKSLYNQFKGLENLGDPATESKFKLKWDMPNFADAPIRLVVFSDFQCPACQALNKALHTIEKRFDGKVNIQYNFYPLDSNCHPDMKRPLHPYACKAAYIASCVDPSKFKEVHDHFFKYQDKLGTTWLNDVAKKYNVTECMNDPKTKESVTSIIAASKVFNVRSTPTMLLNGKKIEGVLPINQLIALIEQILLDK